MNVLFVNDIPFNPIGGGIERVTDVLTKELVNRGYTIFYLCGKLPKSKHYLLDYRFPAQLFQLPNYGLFADEENVAFYKQLQLDLSVDVVINQRGLDGWFNDLLPITCAKLVSVVHSSPDSYVQLFLNQLIELTVPPYVKLKNVIKRTFSSLLSYYWKKKAFVDLKNIYKELADYSDTIVTLSKKDVCMLENLINGSHKANITSIVNPNTFDTTYTLQESKKKIVLYVGRLDEIQKSLCRLLEIWTLLYNKYPDWQLKLVGDGNDKVNLQKYVKEKQLNNVYFEGQQSDVAKYYKEASIVCLTSNFEGWGMALTEGMQYGCIPFTFSNYGAAYEIIDDGINGCLIPAYNLKKYASRLSKLMSDDAMRLKMSMAAIEKVKMFSVENVVDKWEELFKSL